ncbi:MAG: NAD+ synthase [Nitrospiraceae bacterium]|nr:NAD+ synthase [Nitrospiraceae bacterium]
MKIALAQFDALIGGFRRNVDQMVSLSKRALETGCDLVIFPELAICGYPPLDLLERREFIEDNLEAMDRLISIVRGIAVLCGCVSRNMNGVGKPIHNTAVLFEDGRVLARVHKRLLPSYDIFDETRYFEPGTESVPVPFKGLSLGITICEDIWNDGGLLTEHSYPVNPVAELAEKGTDVFITINASPFDTEKASHRYHILRHHATKYHRPFLYANAVGGQDCVVFDGGSMVVDPDGRRVAQARDFAEDLVVVDTETMQGEEHPVSTSREEAVLKALNLGLKDYASRCGLNKVVLGLSGGVDSSLTAVIAAQALGPENVLGVLMPSPYTSRESIDDAEALAQNLGIRAVTLPISNIFDAYLDRLKGVFSGREPDVAEENIQARIRGNLLMAISNKFGYLVLSTGNKTELAVGYCTLYGDLSGGFALISDLPKTMVYEVARYLNSEKEVIPERVLTKPPSAELRPGQKDQDDLPAYDLLDAILRRYLEQNIAPEQIIAEGFDPDIVYRTVRMIDRSEYKRHQAPLGPRVTSRAFGYGRRYPIAHGYQKD